MPNSNHAKYEVNLVQADNRWDFENYVNVGDSQDLYYSGNTAAGYLNALDDDNTAPNAHWWDGYPSGLALGAFSSASQDPMTVEVTKATPPPPPPPAAPTNLQGSASKTTITLTWVDNSNNEDGFYIERSTASSFAEFTCITTGTDTTTYPDPVGAGKVTYYYRVQAFKNTPPTPPLTSDYSNPVMVQKRR